jgi:S-adenosylmethionine:tRNA ribosyltransferase-isomerase
MSELEQYDYRLPPHLVAQHPLNNRADARLMVVNRASGSLTHSHVRDLPEFLAAGDCLVINDTRVVPARLVGYRASTGGRWEGLFLRADGRGNWKVLGKTRGKLAPGETIMLTSEHGQDAVPLRLLLKEADGEWIVRPETDEETFVLLERIGRVPLPHYIREGQMVETDRRRYQTVFAANPGAVAAPTAGLHFTEALLARLEQQGVRLARVTLHVGVDTFRPITSPTLSEHAMHSEWGQIAAAAVATIHQAKAAGRRVVAVGTTSVRVLESAAAGGALQAWSGQTELFIRPPYEFRVVDALLTNFHLPRTTLIVLVQTFGGETLMRRAYEEAIAQEYRFYSYGDAMLIL